MKRPLLTLVLLLGASTVAVAGDFEDGRALYERKDYAAAFAKWTKAAEAGVALAQYNLALMYENGQGAPQDDAQAVRWHAKAAEADVALAQYNLALRYYNGRGVPQDFAQAARWYTKAAEAGVALAQYNLALMYENGQGVAQDDAQAEKWYGIAATTLTDNVEKDKALSGRNRIEAKLRARRTVEELKLAEARRAAEAQRLADEQAQRIARQSAAAAPAQPMPDKPAAPSVESGNTQESIQSASGIRLSFLVAGLVIVIGGVIFAVFSKWKGHAIPWGGMLVVGAMVFAVWYTGWGNIKDLFEGIDLGRKPVRLEVSEFKCEAHDADPYRGILKPYAVARGTVRNTAGEPLQLRAYARWEFDELQANKTQLTEILGSTKPQTFGDVNPSPLTAGSVGQFEAKVSSDFVTGGGKCRLEHFEDSRGRRLHFTRTGGDAR